RGGLPVADGLAAQGIAGEDRCGAERVGSAGGGWSSWMTSLAATIAALFSAGASAAQDDARKAFFELRKALSTGEARAAERDPSAASGWRVNAWVKQGILLGFR